MSIDDTRYYFNELGFNSLCYETGDGEETWSDLNGMYVSISADGSTVELTTIDGLVTSSTGKIGFPNRNINAFILNLEKHRA